MARTGTSSARVLASRRTSSVMSPEVAAVVLAFGRLEEVDETDVVLLPVAAATLTEKP